MKKHILLALLLLAAASLTTNAQITFGTPKNIDKDWKFILDEEGDFSAVKVKDKAWRELDLPHDWSVEGKASPDLASCTGYLPGGMAWYRKALYIPKHEAGRKQFLFFEGVYNNSEVWINGEYLGKRPSGFASFIYDITPYVNFGKNNIIAVKVDHSKSADSRWYTGSGIYRSVWLVSSSKVHIDNWGLFARSGKIDEKGAQLLLSTNVVNETAEDKTLSIRHEIYRKDSDKLVASTYGKLTVAAGAKAKNEQIAMVENPALWSIEEPNLYRVKTTVSGTDGEVLDGTETIIGLRETRFDPDHGFFLNGRNVKMKGVCIHYDAGSLGAVVPKEVWQRRLLTLKGLGCNAIRMSHNPQARVLYDLCDELGFLVMDEAFDEWEFPKRKWIEGWNKGKNPGYQGTSDYFEEWGERDLADMVLRDRNHPSIVMWSIGNEVDYPNDPYSHPILDHEGINQKTIPGYKPEKPHAERIGMIAKKLVPVVKAIDTSRAVTGAMAGVVMSNHTDYPGALDVCGYNYTENRYHKDHISYPERVIYGSENRHEHPQWLAVRDNEYIFGQFLWTGLDYLGEAGPWPSRGFGTGLLDLAGYMKPKAYYRQSLWSDKPMVFAGSKKADAVGKNPSMYDWDSDWNYNEGEKVKLAVFTNCETAQIYINGKLVEGEPVRNERSNALCWDAVYEPGIVYVKALTGGRLAAEYTFRTYGSVSTVQVAADKAVTGTDSIVHLDIALVDKNGERVRNAQQEVKVEVSGAGSLLKMENANPKYMEGFDGNQFPAHRGRMLAYLRTADKAGAMKVKVSVPELGLIENLEVKVE